MLDQIRTRITEVKLAPALILGAGLFLLYVILYRNSLSKLINLWNSNATYSHSFIIPPLIIYLLYLQNKPLSAIPLKPQPLILVPLFFSIIIWLLASITDTNTIELTLLPFIFIFSYTYLIGYRASLLLIGPLFFIIVTTPIWSLPTSLFQFAAVYVNENALQIIGISTYINGTTVSIPAGTFEIEGGCAGIRYLVVSAALGGFFSLLNFNKIKPVTILMTAAISLAIIFNWIRIYIIILIGHFTDMQSPLINDHIGFGWVLYTISLIPLLIIANNLKRLNKKEDGVNIKNNELVSNYTHQKHYYLLTFILFSAPAFIFYLDNIETNTLKKIAMPEAQAPWVGPIYYNEWQPSYKGASIDMNRLYIGTDNTPDISLHIFYYGQQSQDTELINELNAITELHTIKHKKVIELNNHPVIENLAVNRKSENYLVWYWYYIDNKYTITPILAKLLQSKERLTGNISSSLIAVKINCKAECNNERSSLKQFLTLHNNTITQSLLR